MQKIVIATVEFPLESQALNKSLRSPTDTKIKRVIGLKITLVQFTCPNKAIIGLGTNQGRDWALFVLLFSLGNT